MSVFGPLAFLSPWLLLGLLALPVLWWLLRAVPPAPNRVAFPGVRILLGLEDPEKTPDKTPWWLLLLRMVAIAAAILAFAQPVLNPDPRQSGGAPLLLLLDGGWASGADWSRRQAYADDVLASAARDGRPVAMMTLSEPPAGGALAFRAAQEQRERLALMTPVSWAPDRAGFADWIAGFDHDGFDTVWLHDGLDRSGAADLARALTGFGAVTAVGGVTTPAALRPARLEDGILKLDAIRAETAEAVPVSVRVIGPDPAGVERVLAGGAADFDAGADTAEIALDLPLELRNRIARIEIAGALTAGGVVLADDTLRRRKVGLLSGGGEDEGQQLVRPLHYLRKAFVTAAETIEAPLADILTTAPDMIVLADVGTIAPAEQADLLEWVESGGLLLRFAGPRLAKSGLGQLDADPLLPVRLRAGGRSVGGAMSWGAPKRLRPFVEASPFFGLTLPGDVDVSSQVMAQPDPDLPDRVMAALEDGTPLVTGRSVGDGRVILFHVTANAEWSSLPLSGLFVQMLERLTILSGQSLGSADALEGTQWSAQKVLDGFGRLADPPPAPAIDGSVLAAPERSAQAPPGIYVSGDRTAAVNLMHADSVLTPLDPIPGVTWAQMGISDERPLQALLLVLASLLLALDILATLWLSGRLRGAATAAVVAALAAGAPADPVAAQSADERAVFAANNTVLAYVETGDAGLDAISQAGLIGLSQVLTNRTAIEPAEPVAVNLETDEIAIFPFIYWPISERQPLPSDAAYAKLNAFLRSGGMILFDTRDANVAGGGFGTPNGRVLQRLAAKLDVPPLEPLPDDHVLTRTFYLLQAFPGRYTSRSIWVEAAPNAEEIEGVPFRNLNDGVTPVVIGGNDWAAAWAVDGNGNFRFPVGSGSGGQRQREIAYRFGVNLIMHVMTGNYKSDQVHVPALLERLGQ